ncbi:unnamed protein product [Clonostachys rosea]|uniref:Uncharacterized protein n=1 Tax=Bionectria ochroleuca TaxID=29856 RepID=A0ABY6U9H0_BIOOC|nr:unnamed protein product [Clonostachys rosea]
MDDKEIATGKPASVEARTSNVPIEVTDVATLDAPKQPTMAKSKREASLRDYLRIFTYAQKTDVYLIIVGTLASMAAGATLPILNVVFGQLVETFNDYATPGKTQDRVSFDGLLNRYALYIFVLFIARFILSYISKLAFSVIGIRMSAAIRLDYLKHLFAQTVEVLDRMPPGAAAGTITATANVLQIGISEKLGTLVQFLATILAAIIVAFTYSWSLTLVTGSLLVFVAIVGVVLVPFTTKKHQKTFEAEQMASSIANEAFGSIRMIMAYSAQARVGERFSKWANEAKKHGQGMAPIVALQFGLIFFGVYATFGLAFWFGTKSYREGRIESVGIIVIVLMSIMLMVLSIQGLFTPFIAVNKAMVAACEFFSVVDSPPQNSGCLRDPDVSATDDIVFRGIDFAYPGRAHVKVLDSLNLCIEAGKVTAIVGPSGSGKSTVIGLIERWYDLHTDAAATRATKEDHQATDARGPTVEKRSSVPESASPAAVQLRGRVEISGHDIFEIDLKWWRCQIGLVQQEPFLFNDTIYNNVAHGLIGSGLEAETEDRKRELIEEACREAFADEFIQRLPDGYHTMVGESGTKLSGGQRQRISIARAIVKKPKILILDEATSSIDVRGERIVQAALERASVGRTTITIAHRLSTIQKADRIVVLRKGKVVEEGTHQSLLEIEDGVYSGLVATQNLAMDDEKPDVDLQELKEIESRLSNDREDDGEALEGSTNTYKSEYKAQGLLGSFGRLLYELKSQFPFYIATVFFAMCAAEAGTPLQAYLFAKIIFVFQYVDNMDRFTAQANFWSLMWVVLAICTGFSQFGLQFVSNHLAVYISATYRMQYFNGLISQKVSFFDDEDNSAGTLTAKLGSDPRQLEELLGVNMAQVYMAIFNLSGSIAIAFAFGWKLALVAVCVTVPLGFLAGFYRLRHELQFEALSHAVFEESSKFAAESISAFRTVTSLTLEDTICHRYRELLSDHATKASRKSRWTSLILAFSDSMAMACQALIFWYGGRLLGSHEYEVFNFFVCYMAVISGAEAAGLAFSYGPNAAQASAAANRILGIRESKNRCEEKKHDHIATAENGIKIDFQHVWFKYPTRNIPIFEDLSITVEKGQYAAFVGSSGSGKTTIISLLERFYDPNRGKILANGTDITRVEIDEYRKQISLVAQDPTIFQGTIRENIVLGVDANTTDEQVKTACRDASIHDFISSLPDGYSTEIGSKGVNLSGGQKQRIAIARALIRNPQLLLLDEATSSLDSENARIVQAAFEKVSKGRTMIVIAHQLSTIQNADVIFVLGEGKVLEKGNHIELLKRKKIYWNMCQNQALDG